MHCRDQKTAFVLAGGGSLGAIQVGMLAELMSAGVQPDIIVGVSAGHRSRDARDLVVGCTAAAARFRALLRLAGDADRTTAVPLEPLLLRLLKRGRVDCPGPRVNSHLDRGRWSRAL
jgi:Patatin-like phospholipase